MTVEREVVRWPRLIGGPHAGRAAQWDAPGPATYYAGTDPGAYYVREQMHGPLSRDTRETPLLVVEFQRHCNMTQADAGAIVWREMVNAGAADARRAIGPGTLHPLDVTRPRR